MDLSTDTSMVLFGIDGDLYYRSEAKAEQEGKMVTDIIEAYLASWLDQEGPHAAAPMSAGSLEGRSRDMTPSGKQTRTYVMRAWDTLAGIAFKFYGDPLKYTLIAEANGITHPSQLYVGLELSIRPAEEEAKPSVEVQGGVPFRFPLDTIETPYFKFGSLYPSTSRWAGKPHPGVDFANREGAPVYAIGEGRVVINHHDAGGYGHFIMVEHRRLLPSDHAGQDPRVWSLYGHLQPDSSHNGGFVSPPVGKALQGKDIVIGREGKTGYSGGLCHLHFEIRKTPGLRIYSQINAHNLRDHFWDPYLFIPANQFVPIADWPGLDR
jgi:murein DD-endopeptidase MepM/ murein hydrolase activator NlpD